MKLEAKPITKILDAYVSYYGDEIMQEIEDGFDDAKEKNPKLDFEDFIENHLDLRLQVRFIR